ncbi:MAG: bifunctional lysylphosphatidylglycerol flippase/synthetase MprF [Pirellulaceae bacterium]
MKKYLKHLGPIFVVGIFLGAGWLLYHELRQYRIHDIKQAIAAIAPWRILAAMGMTVANYLLLIGYDYLAVRAINHPLPLGKISLASFTGFVTSYNFGAILGGTSVRYRLYSAWGMSAAEILQLVVMMGITFWVGAFALASVVFIAQPFPIPDKLHLPFTTVQPLGYILAVVTIVYVLLTTTRLRRFHLGEVQIQIPRTGMTILQLIVAAIDLMVAAGCLYVLVSHDLTVGYGGFLGIYLLAVVAVIITHVPGGLGVFEVVVLTVAAPEALPSMIAALLLFRVIYYLLPLLIALLLLAGNEMALQRATAERMWKAVGRGAGALVAGLLAWATLIAGAILLLSGAMPIMVARRELLEQTVSLPWIELSHFLSSLVGSLLLLLALGLQRRLDSAWWWTVVLLGVGVVVSLLKGLDYEVAFFLSIVAASLIMCRHRFYRKGALLHERLTPGWIVAVSLALASSLYVGLFVHKHMQYSSSLWWQFTFQGDAPRFLRGSVGAMFVLLLFTVWKLLSPLRPRPVQQSAESLEKAAVIARQSPRTSAQLALLGDKSFLFNQTGTGFIMYATQGRSWIAMGDPVGPDDERAELVWDFRELVEQYDGWPVFYQVAEESLPIYLDQGLMLLKLGDEARVPLRDFSLEGAERMGLRQTYHRIQHGQVEFTVLPVEQVPAMLPELTRISDAWLAEEVVAQTGDVFDERYFARFPCAVVRDAGRIVALANLWCSARREELSIDVMRCAPQLPRDVMEYLFIELMLWGQREGYRWFNLGLAPLSGAEDRPLPPLWNRAVHLTYSQGDRFYNFEGLRKYKEKFHPVWRPKYLASPGGVALPRILTDLAALIARHYQSVEP